MVRSGFRMLRDDRVGMISTQRGAVALGELAEEWHELWLRCPAATPFQSPAWLLPWWTSFGQGRPWALAFRDPAGRLIGLAPLYLLEEDGARTVRFIGAGVSDYLDVLVAPGFEESVIAPLLDELQRHASPWDAVEFQQLPPESPLLRISGGTPLHTAAGEPCPVLSLQDAGAGSARLKANVAADRRRLEKRVGRAVFESATPATLAACFDELRKLHAARWASRSGAGVLADADVAAFHGMALRALFERGIALLHVLRAGSRVAGAYYGFVHRRRAYYYLGGFDPELGRFGIGNQLVSHAIDEARGEGAITFDFLRGRESYKYRWGAVDRPTVCARLVRRPQPDMPDQTRTGVGIAGPSR